MTAKKDTRVPTGIKPTGIRMTLEEAYEALGIGHGVMASIIGCDEKTLYRWRKDGEIDPEANPKYSGWQERAIKCINEAREARNGELDDAFAKHLEQLKMDFKTNQPISEDEEREFYNNLHARRQSLETAWLIAWQNIAFREVHSTRQLAREVIDMLDENTITELLQSQSTHVRKALLRRANDLEESARDANDAEKATRPTASDLEEEARAARALAKNINRLTTAGHKG